MPYGNAALKVEQKPAIPVCSRCVIRLIPDTGKCGKTVDKPIDSAPLLSNHKINSATIGQFSGGHICRPGTIVRQRSPASACCAIDKLHIRIDRTVLAQTYLVSIAIHNREAGIALGIHQRLFSQLGCNGTYERILLRAREYWPTHWVNGQSEITQGAGFTMVQLQPVFPLHEPGHQNLGAIPTSPYFRADHRAVEPEFEAVHFSGDCCCITLQTNQHRIAADLVWRTGKTDEIKIWRA